MAQEVTAMQKLYISLIAGLVFLVVSAPFTYKLVNSLTSAVGLNIADSEGCPNLVGLLIHTLVFVLVVYGLMFIPMKK
jgi:hypothetical protein